MPDELLVTASDPARLDAAVADVSRRLLGSVTGVTPLNPFAATLSLRPGILGEAFLRQIVPTLQGRGFSTDLNYLEPVLPVNPFRPDDNPVEAADPGTGQGGTGRVLVVDSPADAVRRCTRRGDDRSGGGLRRRRQRLRRRGSRPRRLRRLAHRAARPGGRGGVGRRQRSAPSRHQPLVADGVLRRRRDRRHRRRPSGSRRRASSGPSTSSTCRSAAPAAPASAAASPSVVSCATSPTCRRRSTGIRPVYVAAAGNDGADVKHFPAAWRDQPTMQATALLVDLLSPLGRRQRGPRHPGRARGGHARRRIVDRRGA